MLKPSANAAPQQPFIAPYGDSAIHVTFSSQGYNEDISETVLSLADALRRSGDWDDVVCGYDSLVASFNPVKLSLNKAGKRLEEVLSQHAKNLPASPKIIDVPVYYGGQNGPDMKAVMAANRLSESAIIGLHSENTYRVCMMGFVPGFTFLSAAPAPLHHPRHAEPRLSVPAGSVGIAGWQTGIYGLASPGGWQIIGRTPLTIFDAQRETPFLWAAGDAIRFVPMDGPFPSTAQSGGGA